jgi:D-psicose/D-tagatose/L-ribulose 3-epimerase
MRPQLGASLLSWTLPQWTAESGLFAIQQTAATGFDLLEILLPSSMEIDTKTVRSQLKQNHLDVICSLNLPPYAHIPFHPDAATSLIKRALEKTADLGATRLGGVLHGGIGVFSGKPRTALEEDTICTVWSDVAEYAGSLGVTLCIEPINRYETYVCSSGAEVTELIERVNSPNIGLHLDTFHMNIEENNFYDPLIAASSHLKHMHITESDRGMLGEGNVHWDDLFRGLSEIKYSGALVLENFSSSIAGMSEAVSLWRPSKYTAKELAEGSLEFMRAKIEGFDM